MDRRRSKTQTSELETSDADILKAIVIKLQKRVQAKQEPY